MVDTLNELSMEGYVQGVDAHQLTQIMLNQSEYKIGIAPDDHDMLEYVCDAVAAREDISLVIDELDTWFPDSKTPPPDALVKIAMNGRHFDQDLFCITHRPVGIHRNIKSQAVFWIFPTLDETDCATIQKATRRPNLPQGIEPHMLQPTEVEQSTGHVLRTQVGRVSRTEAQILEFDLVTGKLYDSVESTSW